MKKILALIITALLVTTLPLANATTINAPNTKQLQPCQTAQILLQITSKPNPTATLNAQTNANYITLIYPQTIQLQNQQTTIPQIIEIEGLKGKEKNYYDQLKRETEVEGNQQSRKLLDQFKNSIIKETRPEIVIRTRTATPQGLINMGYKGMTEKGKLQKEIQDFPFLGLTGINPISAHGFVQKSISSTNTIPGSPNCLMLSLYVSNSSSVSSVFSSFILLLARPL